MKNLSIKKTIILYMAVNLLISLLLAYSVSRAAERTQQEIWWRYTDQTAYLRALEGPYAEFLDRYPRIPNSVMSPADANLSELCDFLYTWSVLIFSILGSIVVVFIFYQKKIKPPLEELENGSKMIAQNNLDFYIAYSGRDEMGRLCAEFEKMRGQLEENNKAMWKMVEQEKALRSAIAHDIRSPLAVLRGYQEMLLEYVPLEALDKERMLEMLEAGMGQIEHLIAFVDTMRRLSGVDQREVQRKETDLDTFTAQLRDSMEILAKASGKSCEIKLRTGTAAALLDKYIVSEVAENLLANALRYADQTVRIEITAVPGELCILIADDGRGFRESPEQAMKAYYHANPQDDLKHFGLGLYISRLYCEKHGGRLLLGNGENGGAEAKAIFRMEPM